MSVQKSLSGQQIGRYQIKEQITQKRVSDLYVAHDLDQDRAVFLEMLRPTVDEDADLADRFQRRMETVSGLEHPNIAPILDICVTPTTNQAYAAIKYTPGPTLAQKLAELRVEGASLTVFESLKLVRRIADSLVPAHAVGIVHHDLRPANIIIKEGNVPILVDLGVPVVAAPAQPLAKQPIESLDYTPPEQWQGKELSGRSNIYSLGMILYELLAGHRPRLPASEWDIFERDSLPKEIPLEEAHPGFTAETYQLVRDCLWRQEWSRFDTMEQMAAAIDAAFAAEQRASEAVAPPSSRPRWLYVAVALVILAVLGAISLLVQSNDAPTTATPTGEGTAVTTQPPSPEAAALSAPLSRQSSVTDTPLATSSPTSQDTTSQPPTIVNLLDPPPNSQFTSDDEVLVKWIWSSPLEADQQFAVYLTSENEPSLVGTVTEPYRGNEYRLEIESSQFRVERTDYAWQVILEQMPDGKRVAESERRPIRLVAETPTPTPSPTPDAANVAATAAPTATATETACVRTQPFAWQPYTVQSGDALSPLSYETGTSVERVKEVNCLDSNILSVGQVLWLPPFPPTPTPIPTNTSVPTPTATPTGSGGSSGGGSSNPPQPTQPPSPPTPTPPPPP